MKKRLVTTLGAAVACGTALFAQETDMTTDETRIELSAVPPSIMEAARNAVEVDFTYARVEQEPGGLTYELGGKTPDGMGEAVHLRLAAPVERGEPALLVELVAAGVVGAFEEIDAAHVFPPADDLADEALDGIERGAALFPGGLGPAADL